MTIILIIMVYRDNGTSGESVRIADKEEYYDLEEDEEISYQMNVNQERQGILSVVSVLLYVSACAMAFAPSSPMLLLHMSIYNI